MSDKAELTAQEPMLEALHAQLSTATDLFRASAQRYEEHAKEIVSLKSRIDAMDDEIKSRIEAHAKSLTDALSVAQVARDLAMDVRRQMSHPLAGTAKDIQDFDGSMQAYLAEAVHRFTASADAPFTYDAQNAIPVAKYREVARKLISRVGLSSRASVLQAMSPEERLIASHSALDSGFFVPQVLSVTKDCTYECADLLDLYQRIAVSAPSFHYLVVDSHGVYGQYVCPSTCTAPGVEPMRIRMEAGETKSFRGAFCFNREVLQRSVVDLFTFVLQAINRSYRVARNRAYMIGDGVNEPMGWVTANAFPVRTVPGNAVTAALFRTFWFSLPTQWLPGTIVMHPNMMRWLAAQTNTVGDFLFFSGVMFPPVDQATQGVRLSDCLPDPTQSFTVGLAGGVFPPDTMLAAVGNWSQAYRIFELSPLRVQQLEAQSNMFCVSYEFAAEDGGQVFCADAARILRTAPDGP